MQFAPKTEEELKAEMLIPDGVISKNSGNEMITLKLSVFLPDGSARSQKDWLVGSDAPMCIMKIQRFAKACGLMELYHTGAIDQYACQGACGKVKIGSQESAQYGPQNCVVDYVLAGEANVESPPPLPKGPTAQQTRAANEALADAAGNDEECPF
jgi:hypothetical protein